MVLQDVAVVVSCNVQHLRLLCLSTGHVREALQLGVVCLLGLRVSQLWDTTLWWPWDQK